MKAGSFSISIEFVTFSIAELSSTVTEVRVLIFAWGGGYLRAVHGLN